MRCYLHFHINDGTSAIQMCYIFTAIPVFFDRNGWHFKFSNYQNSNNTINDGLAAVYSFMNHSRSGIHSDYYRDTKIVKYHHYLGVKKIAISKGIGNI